MAKIRLIKKIKSKNPTIIVGFQGVGLVGSLAAAYIRENLEPEQIGFIDTLDITPLALIVNTELRFPIRIFEYPKAKLIIFESELPLPVQLSNRIAKEIVDFAKKNKAKRIICMEGVRVNELFKEPKLFGIGNSEKEDQVLKKKGIDLLNNGVMMGLSAAVMLEAKANKVPAICLMSEAHPQYPDGKAAAKIIEGVNKILYGVDIKTKDLLKQAKDFEDKLKKLIEKAQEQRSHTEVKDVLYG